jgi:putative ABC transport system permease protein
MYCLAGHTKPNRTARKVDRIRHTREELRLPRYWIDTTFQDAVYGWRVLWRRPALLLSAVLLIGLTTGATVALTGLADRVLLRPMPVSAPERLVQVVRNATAGGFSQESFPATLCGRLHEAGGQLADLFVIGYPGGEFVSVSAAGFQPESAKTAAVAANAFTLLGVRATIGRLFATADSYPSADPVLVISYDYWQRRFFSAPDILGRSIRLRNQSFHIVGVMTRSFSEVDVGTAPDIWLPTPNGEGGRVLAILKPGATARQLQSALEPTFEEFLRSETSANGRPGFERNLLRRLDIVSAKTGLSASGVRDRFARPLVALSLSCALLLMIGCGNVGLLLLSLQESRRKEMSVRVSLGASRARLVRQTMTEVLLLAAIGCAFGLLLARQATAILVALASDPNNPTRITWEFNWRVASLISIVCVVVTIACGLLPVIRTQYARLSQTVREGSATSAKSRAQLGGLVIATQIALSLVLLMGAGLLQATWHNLDGLNPGFERNRVLIAELQWQQRGDDRAYTDPIYRYLLEQVAALPGISSASLSGWSYFGDNSRLAALVDGGSANTTADENPLCEFMSVGSGFFRTMRTPLLRGREFTGADTEHSLPVAVLSESASRLYFGGQDPVGRRFSIPGFDPQQKIEIVGVASDAKLNSLREPAPATVYLPFLQAQDRGTSATPASLEVLLSSNGVLPAEKLRALIQAASADLAVVRIRTQRALVQRSLVQEHMLSQVSAGVGTLGLLMAALGLAGTVIHSVTRRAKEFGIRLALGARGADLTWMVLRQLMWPVTLGLMIGLPIGLACMRLLRSVLFGVGPSDVPATAGAVLVLGSIATIAAWLPAYRASRIDPAAAIRDE